LQYNSKKVQHNIFKKLKINILILFFTTLLSISACTSKDCFKFDSRNQNASSRAIETSNISLPVLKVIDTNLLYLIDSLVIKEEHCSYYKPFEIDFVLKFSVDSLSRLLSINSSHSLMIDYSICTGVFSYRNTNCIVKGEYDKNILNKTKDSILLEYIELDSISRYIHNINDMYSFYFFKYDSNGFRLSGECECTKADE